MYKFSLTDSEELIVEKWLKKHRKKNCGLKTFSFTPTGIGSIVVVSCQCGEKKDVTDIGSW